MRRLIPVAVAALVTAGCASATAGGPGATDGAASVVPGDAIAFVATTTDLRADEWHSVGELFLSQLEQGAQAAWTDEVEPALGDELDVAVLSDKQVVALTQPPDDVALAALARKHGLHTRRVEDWTAISKSAAALQRIGPSALSLSENNRFLSAMDRLPGDALVRAYVSGDRVQQLLAAIPGQLETSIVPIGTRFRFGRPQVQRSTGATVGALDLRWGAAALTSEDEGLRLEGFARTGALVSEAPPRYVVQPTPAYPAGLVDEIPADVLAVVDFPIPASTFQLIPKLPPPLAKLLGGNQFALPQRLDAIVRGESALYVRAALPSPEVTLVTQPNDTAAASSAIDDVLRTLPPTSGLHDVTLYRAVIGGQLVVSTSRAGIAHFRGAGPKLSADPDFQEAKELSGLPDEVNGFLYANVADALPLLRLAGTHLPADLPDLRTLLAYGAQAPNERTFTAFLRVGTR